MQWGIHFLASDTPISDLSIQEFVDKMPQKAREDLLEWNPKYNIIDFVSLLKPLSGSSFDKINSDRNFIVTDNRPYNEYFFLADLNFQNSKVETNTKS